MPSSRILACLLLAAVATTIARTATADEAVAPIARLGIGPAFHTAPTNERSTELAVEATLGVNVALEGWRRSGPVLSAETGYGYDGIGFHAAHLAAGIGYGHPLLFLSYHPRLLVGSAGDGFAIGMRNGVGIHMLGDLGAIEVGHQFFHDDAAIHQDVRVIVSINPGAVAYLLSKL